MRESLFTPYNVAAQQHYVEGDPSALERVRLAAAWHRAIGLAIESAFAYGKDLPVGAVALEGENIIGRGYANDNRFGSMELHAEVMAQLDAQFDVWGGHPDTLVTTLEPCEQCQDGFARVQGLRKVAFGISRQEIAKRNLIKAHDEDIFGRIKRLGLPYEVVQIEDDELSKANLLIFDHVSRDTETGITSVDTEALRQSLQALNEE